MGILRTAMCTGIFEDDDDDDDNDNDSAAAAAAADDDDDDGDDDDAYVLDIVHIMYFISNNEQIN